MSLIEVRAADLTRVGTLEGYSTGQAIPRWCGVGSWRFIVPGRVLIGDRLDALLTGGGIIATSDDGNVLASGPLTKRIFTRDASTGDDGSWELQGVTDEVALQDRLIYPDPTSPADTQAADAYDDRTGPAETVLRGYVNANCGPGALLARRSLLVEPDLGRGASVSSSYRFANLLDAAVEICAASGIGFRVVQLGSSLVFQVIEPEDLSALIRLTFPAGTLSALQETKAAPDVTHPVVAGQGEGTARVFVEGSSSSAEAEWGRRIERSYDRRDTADPAVLAQAVADNIAAGAAKGGIKVTPVDTVQTRFARDYGLGAIITASNVPNVVREAVLTFGIKDQASPVVGDPAATDTPDLYVRLARIEAALGRSTVAD